MSLQRMRGELRRGAGLGILCLAVTLLDGCPRDACNNECTAGTICDATLKACVSTLDAGPVSCTADSQCPGGLPRCDTSTMTCVACLTSADCPTGRECNASSQTCTTGCQGMQDCAMVTGKPICDLSGDCVECTSDLNCTEVGGVRRTCDPGTNACILNACTVDSECLDDPAGGLICDTTTGGCVQCMTDTECSAAATPHCSTAHACVACNVNADCNTATGETCDTTTNTCVMPACGASTTCPADGHCSTTTGECVACLQTTDCDFGGSCQGGGCTQPASCTADSDCLFGTFCVSGVCATCRTNADCVSGQTCVVSGGRQSCQAPTSCTHSNVCGAGLICTGGVCVNADCMPMPMPVNDSPGLATALPLSGTTMPEDGLLCPNDTEYYQLAVPPNAGAQVTVTYSPSTAPVTIELIPGPELAASAVTQTNTHAGTVQATLEHAPAGTRAVLVAVSSGTGQAITYQLTATVNANGLCAEDPRQPDNTLALASPLTPGSYPGSLCAMEDEWYSLIVPANSKPVATITSNAGATDLELIIDTTINGGLGMDGYAETDATGAASLTGSTTAPAGGQQYWIEVVNATEQKQLFTLNVDSVSNPPPNALCASAAALPVNGTTMSSSNESAGNTGNSTCGGLGGDVFWTLTLPTASEVGLQLAADFDAVLSLSTDCDDSGELSCAGALSMNQSLSFQALAAGTYIVRVAGNQPSNQGHYTLTTAVSPAAPTVVATCTAPQVLSFSSGAATAAGSVALAANDITSPCGHSGGDAVYLFTLSQAQKVDVTLTGFPGAAVTLVPAASCQAPAGATCVTQTGTTAATLNVNAVPAGDYVLIVDGGSSVAGQYSMQVNLSPPIYEPPNDTCATAIALGPGTSTVTGDTRAAVVGSYVPACGSGTSGAVIYSITTTAEEQIGLDLDADYDAAVSITDSPCGTGASLGCDYSGTAHVVLPVVEAGTYYVWVDGHAGGTGTFSLTSNIVPAQPLPTNTSCGTATAVDVSSGSASVSGSTLRATNTLDPTTCVEPGALEPLTLAGPDVVYSASIPAGKTLQAVLDPTDFDGAIYSLTSCALPLACGAASDTSWVPGSLETIQVPNTGSTALTVYVVVGSYAASASGSFTVAFTLQ